MAAGLSETYANAYNARYRDQIDSYLDQGLGQDTIDALHTTVQNEISRQAQNVDAGWLLQAQADRDYAFTQGSAEMNEDYRNAMLSTDNWVDNQIKIASIKGMSARRNSQTTMGIPAPANSTSSLLMDEEDEANSRKRTLLGSIIG